MAMVRAVEGGDVHLTAYVADAGDDGHHCLHLRLGRRIVAGLDVIRPSGFHDRTVGAGQRVPDLLGDKGGKGYKQASGDA